VVVVIALSKVLEEVVSDDSLTERYGLIVVLGVDEDRFDGLLHGGLELRFVN